MSADPVVLVSDPVPGVRLVAMNRPDARNAVNGELAEQLGMALLAADEDAATRVIILTGDSHGFSAGLDLKAFLQGETVEWQDRGFAGFVRRPPSKPLIAAVEGFALAGGLELALACDLIVASRSARFGIPEVKRGLVADGGALLRLADGLPYRVAMEMALTGDEVSPETLHSHGLVNVVTEPGQAVHGALELASRIAANAPMSLRVSKQIMRMTEAGSDAQLWAEQEAIAEPVWASHDAEEGATAFAEKRPPVFKGV